MSAPEDRRRQARSALACRRARAELHRERTDSLDHSVTFLIEDSWRSPISTDPLRPSRSKPYPIGKQAWAWTSDTTAASLGCVLACLVYLQSATRWKVSEEMREASELAARRLWAAKNPLAVIEPQSSIPGHARIVAELEKRCHLPIEEVRSCFRQGHRSEQREAVEEAIRAMVKHHRMVHPVFELDSDLGMQQWKQAREAWREFIGQSLVDQNNRRLAFEVFGEDSSDERADDGALHPASYDFDDRNHYHVARARAPRTKKKPQILPRVAEVLGVSKRTVERIVSQPSDMNKPRQFPARQVAS